MNSRGTKYNLTIKMVIIASLLLILLIPSSMISSLIYERLHRKNEAINEITSTWGEEQTISGPVLAIPYTVNHVDSEGKTIELIETAYFLPEVLEISGFISPEIRYRGIYQAIVYESELAIQGVFLQPDFASLNIASHNVLWEDAFLSIGITDMAGVQESIQVSWNDQMYSVAPGSQIRSLIGSGVNTAVAMEQNDITNFAFTLNLRGSQGLNVLPFGKETLVKLSSNWEHPSFRGRFLPAEREISKDGFTANWRVLHLNRNYPQQWREKDTHAMLASVNQSTFGVNLHEPVDLYQKNVRSVKYAALIIFLTFLVLFFIEVLSKVYFHPIQYLLVGFALIVFYLLLLSLSEHLGFLPAYLIASLSTIGLISLYAGAVLTFKKTATLMATVLTFLYIFLYIMLENNDFSLLIGSIGLFVILALIMYLSRNINWHERDL